MTFAAVSLSTLNHTYRIGTEFLLPTTLLFLYFHIFFYSNGTRYTLYISDNIWSVFNARNWMKFDFSYYRIALTGKDWFARSRSFWNWNTIRFQSMILWKFLLWKTLKCCVIDSKIFHLMQAFRRNICKIRSKAKGITFSVGDWFGTILKF